MQIPAVIINLTRQPERFEWIAAQAQRVGLAIERLEAVDAKDPDNTARIDEFRAFDTTLSPAEAGCFLSHRRAWEYATKTGAPYLAVFEDDVHLSQDIARLLDLDTLPEGLDLIKLEVPSGKVVYAQKSSATMRGRTLHRLLTRAYGTGAYVISSRCAQRLLELTQTSDQPVDVFMFDDFGPVFREFPVLQIVPAPCIQDANLSPPENNLFASSIAEERQASKAPRKSKGNRKSLKTLRRYIRNLSIGESIFLKKKIVPFDLGDFS